MIVVQHRVFRTALIGFLLPLALGSAAQTPVRWNAAPNVSPSAPVPPVQVAAALPGSAAALALAVTAPLRAWITASSVSRSCFM